NRKGRKRAPGSRGGKTGRIRSDILNAVDTFRATVAVVGRQSRPDPHVFPFSQSRRAPREGQSELTTRRSDDAEGVFLPCSRRSSRKNVTGAHENAAERTHSTGSPAAIPEI